MLAQFIAPETCILCVWLNWLNCFVLCRVEHFRNVAVNCCCCCNVLGFTVPSRLIDKGNSLQHFCFLGQLNWHFHRYPVEQNGSDRRQTIHYIVHSVSTTGNRCHLVLLDNDESYPTADRSNIGTVPVVRSVRPVSGWTRPWSNLTSSYMVS